MLSEKWYAYTPFLSDPSLEMQRFSSPVSSRSGLPGRLRSPPPHPSSARIGLPGDSHSLCKVHYYPKKQCHRSREDTLFKIDLRKHLPFFGHCSQKILGRKNKNVTILNLLLHFFYTRYKLNVRNMYCGPTVAWSQRQL